MKNKQAFAFWRGYLKLGSSDQYTSFIQVIGWLFVWMLLMVFASSRRIPNRINTALITIGYRLGFA